MSDDLLVEQIARILSDHVLAARDSRCSCDLRGPRYFRTDTETATERHIAHLAPILASEIGASLRADIAEAIKDDDTTATRT